MVGAREAPASGPRIRTRTPGGRFLSNGRYTVLLTRDGGGRSSVAGLALTRWNADRLEDASGLVFWVRDLAGGAPFTIGAGATAAPGHYHTAWRPGRCSIVREEGGISARLDVCVVPDADAELRRVMLVNRTQRHVTLELTSFAEVVLHVPAADAAHPAFSKLFIQTEYDPEANALLARRRPRGAGESFPWLVHALIEPGPTGFETDRARFTGRVAAGALPEVLATGAPLSGTTGSVLDPVLALRRRVELAPGSRAELTFVLGVAADRAARSRSPGAGGRGAGRSARSRAPLRAPARNFARSRCRPPRPSRCRRWPRRRCTVTRACAAPGRNSPGSPVERT